VKGKQVVLPCLPLSPIYVNFNNMTRTLLKFIQLGGVLVGVLLAGCAAPSHQFVQSQIKTDLLQENWQGQIESDPYQWRKHADNWLWFGKPNSTEAANRNAPFSTAMSTMMVKVPDFTVVKVKGDFQVQLDGRFQHNSVYLYGPNEEIRQVVVEVKNHVLDVHLPEDSTDPKHVIVRIAIHNLQGLVQSGSGKVEGRLIRANPLVLTSEGSGDLVLTGKINVKQINHTGSGDVTILGAYTPYLKIYSAGRGALNMKGRIGVAGIIHNGTGNINIAGADTNALSIWTQGAGKIGIKGVANVQQINAGGNTNVYLYAVKSKNLYVYARDKAIVGLAGQTKSLYVDAKGSSSFLGRYLHSKYTYVRAREWAHVNTAADIRAFAAADNNSSVYIMGYPDVISPYVNDNAVIVPIDPPPSTPTQLLEYKKKTVGRFGTETYLP
jgi:hypothetical protein